MLTCYHNCIRNGQLSPHLLYVYSCLSEATYNCVAEQEGKVVGIIIGNAKSDYIILPHLKYMFRTIQYGIKMKYHGRKLKNGIEDYKRLYEVYHSFSRKQKVFLYGYSVK